MIPVDAMIIARSTSSRYPRKHLGILGGKPMIVQIIKRLKMVKGLRNVILSTTENKSDDELVRIAHDAGALYTRGPEIDILTRQQMTVAEHEMEYFFICSGDCPFFNTKMLERTMEAVNKHPGYDTYSIIVPLSNYPGLSMTLHRKTIFSIYQDLVDKYRKYRGTEYYHVVGTEQTNNFSTWSESADDLISRFETPMKLSIDWPFEMAIFNKMIDYLGFYPEDLDDIYRAYREIHVI